MDFRFFFFFSFNIFSTRDIYGDSGVMRIWNLKILINIGRYERQ